MPERIISYQSLDHKADMGFHLQAPSLERLYIDSALALTDLSVKLERINSIDKHDVLVEADSKESLLIKWLNEVLFLFERHKFLPKRIVFTRFDGKSIKATLIGETYDPIRHGHVSEVKAVTHHQLEMGTLPNGENNFYAKVFLDV
ncbi:MAG: archease [Proteobacteria bacterium]|nr:archease [Pseudomonadota bacterium]NDD03270.1 archease [Pseudomonadota bacterium]NDG25652.1 archease [Pseudomonadota bacterium]